MTASDLDSKAVKRMYKVKYGYEYRIAHVASKGFWIWKFYLNQSMFDS